MIRFLLQTNTEILGLGSDWHLNYISLRNVQTNEIKKFHFNKWISAGNVYTVNYSLTSDV